MKNFKSVFSLASFAMLLSVSITLPGLADDEVPDTEMATEKAIVEKFLSVRPDITIKLVRPSLVEGYYEVHVNGGMILYSNATADHFFAGDIYMVEPTGFVNATERARNTNRKELLASLDDSEMIVFAPAEEKTRATLTVFTDIDCGYCRKLHQEVPELNRMGIAVRYLAYPRAGVGSASFNKAVSAWCADDPQTALTRAKAGQAIDDLTCANPVAAQYALGDKFGVNGTPAIIFEDGTLQPGYLPADRMAAKLGLN